MAIIEKENMVSKKRIIQLTLHLILRKLSIQNLEGPELHYRNVMTKNFMTMALGTSKIAFDYSTQCASFQPLNAS